MIVENPFGEVVDLRGDILIGAHNMFNPQCLVVSGPSVEELEDSLLTEKPVQFHLTSRTADMCEDEPDDDLGDYDVVIHHLKEVAPGIFGIAGVTTSCRFSSGRIGMWIWEYDPSQPELGARTDFLTHW